MDSIELLCLDDVLEIHLETTNEVIRRTITGSLWSESSHNDSIIIVAIFMNSVL